MATHSLAGKEAQVRGHGEAAVRFSGERMRNIMAAGSKLMMIEAERRFPVRVRIGAPLKDLAAGSIR